MSTNKKERFKNRLWTKNLAKSRKILPFIPEKNNFYTEYCDLYTPFSPTCGKLFPEENGISTRIAQIFHNYENNQQIIKFHQQKEENYE